MEELVMLGGNPAPEFWLNKRVLVTGHSGFKGGWLALWLRRLGAQVSGLSLPPRTSPNLFDLARVDASVEGGFGDICHAEKLRQVVVEAEPEIVFHLAAQALVRPSYREPLETIATNVVGTANLLEALRHVTSVKAVVCVTTDKVYHNLELPTPYRETDHLGGHDPYSASKAAAEIIISCYRSSFLREAGVAVASARAGNVIGGGDWSEDRLIPDAIRAWSADLPLSIRRPNAVRPWQHVLEPLFGYIKLAEGLWDDPTLAEAYNFGPPTHEAATVRDVVLMAAKAFGNPKVEFGDGSQGPHEAGLLTLDASKAQRVLGVEPRWGVAEAVTRTIHWYRDLGTGQSAQELCIRDIVAFEQVAVGGVAR